MIPIRKEKRKNTNNANNEDADNDEGSSQKLTGPLQFGIGRSVNQVQLINPLITSHFVGKEKTTKNPEGKVKVSKQQSATFGRFYSVEYALVKVHGALNPENLGNYLSDRFDDIKKNFIECENRIFECLWNGTNELVTRSKFPQRSILYLEVTYKDSIYNDLPDLVIENGDLKKRATALGISPFEFTRLKSMIEERKDEITKIRVKGCLEIRNDLTQLIKEINSIKDKLIEEIVV